MNWETRNTVGKPLSGGRIMLLVGCLLQLTCVKRLAAGGA